MSESTAGNELAIRDWSQYVSFSPSLYFRPKSLDELRGFLATVLFGPLPRRGIRVLGGLHSCSRILESETVLDLEDLPKTIEFAPDNSSVIVSATWHLHDFLLELSLRGKSITATGGTDAQTLAGLISTSTAPATPKHSLYDLLEWIEYLSIDSATRSLVEKRVTATDPAFRALVCSLGVAGIITKVKFNLIDELHFETVQKVIDLDDVLGDLGATSAKYDFWRIDWIPDSGEGLLWAATRIPREKAKPNGDYPSDKAGSVLKFVFDSWDKLRDGKAGPLLDPAMRGVYFVMSTLYKLDDVNASGPLRNMLPVDRRAPLRVAMAEWGFNPADLQNVLKASRDYFEAHGWPNLPIEIELAPANRYYMSPWNWDGLDHVLKFNFMYLTDVCRTPEEKAQLLSHLRGLWDHFTALGIPFKAHWGKLNFLDPAFVAERYQLEEFRPFIQPAFLNSYVAERIGVDGV